MAQRATRGAAGRVSEVLGRHRRARRGHADHHPQVRHPRRAFRPRPWPKRSAIGEVVRRAGHQGTHRLPAGHDRDHRRRARPRLRRRHHARAPAERPLLARRAHRRRVALRAEEGSALDEEAYERGTSVYFTERAVHMFPHELATGLCSLNPHVDRLVQSCLMDVDGRGHVVRYEMHDGVINSDGRMTYTDVNAILTERDPAVRAAVRAPGAVLRADARALRRAQRAPPPARRHRLRPAGGRGGARRGRAIDGDRRVASATSRTA